MITRTEMTAYSTQMNEYVANQTSTRSGGGNVFVGGDGNNTVTNYANGTIIKTGKGEDTVTSIAGGVVIDTGDGDDTIIAVGMGTNINAGAGNDKIYAQGSEIFIDKGTGKDEVYLSGNKIEFAKDADNIGDIIKSAAFIFKYVKNQGLVLEDMYNIEDFLPEEDDEGEDETEINIYT